MARRDQRIDHYILNAQEFARPILIHLRELVHEACPEVEETMKWSMPFFDYKGDVMCHMAAFKKHCAFGFWKAALLDDKKNILQKGNREAMGNLGKIESIKDLPPDKALIALIRAAKKLNDEGKKLPSRAKPAEKDKKELKVPADFLKELKKDKTTFNHWQNFSFSKQNEYVTWITEAKTEETRMKRMDQALDWIGEGKHRNWKYEK